VTTQPKNLPQLQHPPEHKSSHEDDSSAQRLLLFSQGWGKQGRKYGRNDEKGL